MNSLGWPEYHCELADPICYLTYNKFRLSGYELLMSLCKLPGHDNWSIATMRGKFSKRPLDSMRGFEEHDSRWNISDPLEPLFSVLCLSWNKPSDSQWFKRKTRCDGSRKRSARAWDWVHRNRLLPAGLNECQTRIGYARRAGVTDEGDLGTGLKALEKLGNTLPTVVFVKAEGGCGDGVMGQQFCRAPGVFRRDQVCFAQDPKRSKRDVLQVPNGRGDDEERAGHRAETYCTIARCALASSPEH